MHCQLDEMMPMLTQLTPDQLLAARLMRLGLLTSTQIRTLGRIRQELYAMGLEYDLEKLLLLFHIVTTEQIREAALTSQRGELLTKRRDGCFMQPHMYPFPLALVSVAALKDTALLTQWETHLQLLERAGLISIWSPLHLKAGASHEQELRQQLERAHLILLLLSADFFNSPDCLAMMEQALQRSQTGAVQVIPLLLRPVAWQESSLSKLEPWPSNGVSITQWGEQDAAWDACVQSLRRLLGRHVSRPSPVGPAVKHTDRDWERMLRRLRREYKELLNQSLHDVARIELDLSTQPDMVSNVTTTDLLFRLPQSSERLLASGTSILDAYDEAEGELLILGEPGAGKSTLLLDLAQQLVGRAFADPDHALPVIFRLSSWAIRQSSLTDWMVEQLSQTYDVPPQLSERWVKEGRLLPLLDGLDEIKEDARPACIAAINTYHRTHLIPLVVCSRRVEYEVAAGRKRLGLQSAVLVRPLSDMQIDAYLQGAGFSFAEIRAALHQTPVLWQLATTPLMLSVLLQTYQGASTQRLLQPETDLEQQVWTDYVQRQVAEKGNDIRYPLERTLATLSWLAQQMRVHHQSIFYAEYLQTDWLAHNQQRTLIWLAIRLPAVVIGVGVGLFVPLLLGGPPIPAIGLLGGFVGGCLSQQTMTGPSRTTRRFFNEKLASFSNAVLLGLLFATSTGDWVSGSILGLGSGLSFWIFQKLLHRTSGRVSKSAHGLWGIAPRSIWQAAIVLGAGIALSGGLGFGLSTGLHIGLIDGLAAELTNGLSIGLIISIMTMMLHIILADSIGSLHFAEHIHWTWRGLFRAEHLRTSLSIAGALFLCFGLSGGLYYGLYYGLLRHAGLINGLSIGLIDGLHIGLSNGLAIGLSYWIILGLYQGMEHLEDQDRQQFNQGIRRSLRNGLLLGLISALIISTIDVLSGGLSSELSYWLINGLIYELSNGLGLRLINGLSGELSGGLSYWLNHGGLSYIWIWLLAGTAIIWALSGGFTILNHYVIRWLLARHRTLPWRSQAFLDDATSRNLLQRESGGYSFFHRRLQDYLAGITVPPTQK